MHTKYESKNVKGSTLVKPKPKCEDGVETGFTEELLYLCEWL
jgi:hypothetical protein